MRVALRGLGWLCISLGVLVALYLIYSLYWTGLETSRAQAQLLDEWVLDVGEVVAPDAERGVEVASAELPIPELGEALAAMQFHRPGDDQTPVYDEPLLVVEGVDDDVLRAGPGHYPTTAMPGQPGNFAVAGHRTTYGAPFYDLDDIEIGDQILVTDRNGSRWTYEVVAEEIVAPDDGTLLRRDPLDLDRPVMTLTTCHPRWSNTERLIVHAQLSDADVERLGA